MKIIYIHHAERDINNKSVSLQDQDITNDGLAEAEYLSKKIGFIKPRAIYSSSHLRCMHTSEILNREVGVPIIVDDRFREWEKSESFREFLERNIMGIDDIVNKYKEDSDVVICITSGVNLSAFCCYFSGSIPSDDTMKVQGLSMSPVLFTTDGRLL